MMRKVPGYKKTVKSSAKKMVDDLEKMFQKEWENDATVNEGEHDYDEEDDEFDY